MEHKIVMIPIEALVHHPDNQRKELGVLLNRRKITGEEIEVDG